MYLFRNRILKDEVLKGAHESRFIVYPICTKMYKDLKNSFLGQILKGK